MKNPTANSQAPARDAKTTGNAATSATAAPPAEKRTQIGSAIKPGEVEEVTNVNFNISIGRDRAIVGALSPAFVSDR